MSLLRRIPRRSPSQAFVNLSEGGCRDCLGEPIKRLIHNHAKFALSLPLSLSPSLGSVTAEDRPPSSASGCDPERAHGEKGAYRNLWHSAVCHSRERCARLARIMDSMTKLLFGEACHHTLVTRPEAAELQIDEHRSLNGS